MIDNIYIFISTGLISNPFHPGALPVPFVAWRWMATLMRSLHEPPRELLVLLHQLQLLAKIEIQRIEMG